LTDPDEPLKSRITVQDVPEEDRLDAYLARRLAGLSRSRVAQLIADGHVRVNSAAAKKSQAPEVGDVIDVDVPAAQPTHMAAEEIDLRILFQDADIVVLDKPAGLVVHPAPGHRTGTLVNALLHHVTDLSGVGGVLRPGIVHRLDKDTSGLLLVAKNDDAHRILSEALKQREIGRMYLAAVWGHLDDDRVTIDKPMARSRGDRQRMAISRAGEGKRAVTHVRRIERWVAADLLRVKLETGRTHQIRVHLTSLNHPVVGDVTYGRNAHEGMRGTTTLSWAREFARRVPRHFLHATELRFAHPRTAEAMRFESPLPADLVAAAEWARSTSGAENPE
jgi:23S rRNA pseudouridine1911/1915/1917 synthase